MQKVIQPINKKQAGKAGAFSAFGAADNIKYRKYTNRMSLNEGDKSVPLSKEQWLKSGRPD